MLQTAPWRLAALAGLGLVPACATAPTGSYLDETALIKQTAAQTKYEVCRGQKPIPISNYGAGPIEFDALPSWAQAFIIANAAQWETGCGDGPD